MPRANRHHIPLLVVDDEPDASSKSVPLIAGRTAVSLIGEKPQGNLLGI